MSDPVTGAVASAVASKSISKVVDYIENSEDPEEIWKESARQLAIKVKTTYKQNKIAKYSDDDDFSRELERSGKFAMELAVRGQEREFNQNFCDLLEDMASTMTDLARYPNTASSTMVGRYEEVGLNEDIEKVLDS